jgi:hypothetical protein
MIKPLRNIPFNLIVKSISGFDVKFFDAKNQKHIKVLEALKDIGFNLIGSFVSSKRPNEVGNKIEPLVLDEFKKQNIEADKPKNSKGKRQSSGYPDIEFDFDGEGYYLECKTFNRKNLDETLRTFYFSPSENCKITKSTIHFLLSFEMEKIEEQKFKVVSFKIISINSMLCDLKSEFNASNKVMYSGKDGASVLFDSFSSIN